MGILLKVKDWISPSVIDIRASEKGVAGKLSNFYPYEFNFYGLQCASMEGLLQSFKTPDPVEQKRIRALAGKEAKAAGQELNNWQDIQTLYCMNEAIERHSDKYMWLYTGAFLHLSQNKEFAQALLSTGDKKLTHSIGCNDPYQTVLTEKEFCRTLYHTRIVLRHFR